MNKSVALKERSGKGDSRMNLSISDVNREISFVPYLPQAASSVEDILIGSATPLSYRQTFAPNDLIYLSARSLSASASYRNLVKTEEGLGTLQYSYTSDELNFSLSSQSSEFKADLQGNVSFLQDTLNVRLQIQVEELNVVSSSKDKGKGKGNGKGEVDRLKHVRLNFDLDKTSFEYLLKGSGSKDKSSDLIFDLLKELAHISIKDEKKSILILFGNREAVGVLSGKIGQKIMELVLFIVTASHLNSNRQKTHYNIWLYGGSDGDQTEDFLYSFEKIHFEMDLVFGGKVKGDNGKHKGWFKPGDG